MAEVLGTYYAHGTHTKFAAVLKDVTTSSTVTTTTITVTATGRHYNNDTHSNTVSVNSLYGIVSFSSTGGGTVSPADIDYPATAVSVAAGKGKTADGPTLTYVITVPRGTSNKTISSITFHLTSTISDSTSSAAWGSSITVPALPSYNIVYYNHSGGGGSITVTSQYGSTPTARSSAVGDAPVSGYTFQGWATSAANAKAGTVSYAPGASLGTTTGNRTLYGVWKRTITFKHGKANASSNNVTQYYGNTVTPPSITAISGWTALGWRDDTSVGAKEYGANNTTAFTYTGAATTLYAVYSRTLTLSYTNGGGSGTAPTATTATQYYNANGSTAAASFTLAANTFTAPSGGYGFSKWGAGNASASWSWNPGVDAGASTSTAAVWTRTITFKHGKANATTSTATQTYNSTVTPPSITAISGWTALGWRDDTSAGAKEYGANNTTAFTYTPTTQTLYAVYSRTLTISYANGGGTGTNPSNTTTTQYYNANGAITSPSVTLATNPYSRSGYYFSSWLVSTSNTSVASGGSYTWSIAVDVTTISRTATAQWSAYYVTLRYNVNGGTVTTNTSNTERWRASSGRLQRSTDSGSTWADVTQNVATNTEYANMWNVGTPPITKTGYSVVGTAAWNTKADGTGIDLNQDYSSSSTTNPVTAYRLNGNAYLTSNITIDVYPKWVVNSYALTVDPNGGTWGGSTSAQSFTQNYATTKAIAAPTRTGYTFVGWAETGPGSLAKITQTDPAFDSSSGGVGVYNNSGGGTVTHTRQSSSAGTAYGSYEILINSTSGTTSPGNGGFVQNTTSAANKKYIHAFVAKIPTGYTVQQACNATGDGRTITWLTDRIGTGAFKVYAYQHNCGSTGTFSTFGHVYLDTGSRPVSWQLAYSSMLDITDGTANTYTYGAGAGRLTALWAGNKYSVAFNANGGSGSMTTQTDFFYGTAKALSANGFTAPSGGYTFQGWATSAANAAAGTVAYANQANMTTGTTTNGGTVTLYAVWKRTITFKSGNPITTPNPTATQYYGGNLTPPSITAISGWTPLGWRDDTSAGSKEYGANNTTAFAYTSTTQTLYAVYSRTLTISYANGGGTGTAPSNTTTTQYYNANGAITSPSVTLATNPYTQSGCTFARWMVSTSNTAVSSGGSYTWSIAVDATTVSRTATAQWNITVTATGVNTSYDGSAHSASISVAIAGTTVQYGTSTSYGYSLTATNANTSYNMSSVSVTNVADGTQRVYYKVSKSGYLDQTGSVAIKINARTVTWTAPTAASGTLTYDGNAKVLATIGSASAGGVMYYYVSDSATSPTFSTSTWKTTIDTKINAGTWYIHYYCYVSDTNNNTGTNINTAAKISKVIAQANNPISVTATQSITGVNYNISTQDKSFTAATNAQGAVTYAVQSQKNSSDTTVNYFSIPTNTTATLRTAANTPAGTYTVVIRATAAGNTNYKSGYKDITITVTVTSYTVTITKGTGIASVTYKLGSGSATTYSSAITVPVGQTVTYGATVSTGYTWWKWTGTHASTTNAYSFTMTTSNVADTANAMQQVSVPTWKNSLTYDGSAQGATATTLWNNYSTTSLTIGGTTSGTNATSYNATFTPKSGYCWSDGTTTAKTVSWSIAQKEVSLVWGDISWIYDGDEHSTTCTADNLISGDSCTVTLTNNSVGPNVGTTTVTASSLSNNNYKLPSAHTATLTISQRTITWAAPAVASGTLTYDGSAKVLASVGTASTGGTMYYYVNNSSTAPTFSTSTWKTTIDTKSAAGTWYVHYRCYVSDTTNNKGSNINVTYTINKTINQREVTLTWGTVTWTYDGNTHSTTCTVGNLVSGDSCTVTLTGNSVGANVGTATVTASSLSNSNYKLPSTNTTTLTINRASVGAKPTTSVTKIYTGSSLNNNYTTPTGVNMTGDNNGIGVGTYSAVYTPDGNHKWSDNTTTAVTVTLTINNATLTVTAPNQSYTYDESAHGNAITVTTVGSQTPTIKYGTTSGSYTLTSAPQITNVADSKTIYYQVTAPNHTDKTGSYTLTITKRTVTPTAPTLTTGSLIYNGNAKTLANPGSCTTGGTMYYYVTTGSAPTFSKSTWNTSIDTQINAGTYNIYWYCCVDDVANNNDTNSDNINTVITLGSRTIGNATMTITATPYSDDYDGVAHSAQIKSSVASTTISYGISTSYGNSVTAGTSNVSMSSVTRTNPGTTTVYYKASKANYNDVTGSTTITITGVPVHTKVGGVWKHGIVYVNVGGSWKKATTGYVKVNGTWKVIDK